MKKILLDTNFLLASYQFKVDIFSLIDKILTFRYEFFVLDKTLDEVKGIIAKQKGKNKEAAKFALKLLAVKNIKIIKTKSDEKTDDIIVGISSKSNFIVATQDKELRRRLRQKSIPILLLRQKKKVEFLNPKVV